MTGVYIIKNLVNGKVYIGQSKNVRERIYKHKSRLRHGVHKNSHLQNAFRKYGEKAFWFGPLCECLEDELDQRERVWIEWYRATNRKHGYNLESGGHAQKTMSEETRRKISERLNGRICGPLSEEHRRKVSEGNKGKPKSEEHKHNLSEAWKGRPPISDETRRKQSEYAKNRPEETLRKMSEKAKGRTLSEETRRKISEKQTGKRQSEETRRKRSESNKLYWARKKAMENET